MSLGDHLEDLRRRIILALIGPVVCGAVMLLFGKQAVALICVPGRVALARLGLPPQLLTLSPAEGFAIYLKVSLIGGLIIALPWVMWQFWKFVAPGLYRTERRFVLALVPGSIGLTITGVLFMYYLMLPVTLAFLLGFSMSFPADPVDEAGWFNWVFDRVALAPAAPDAEPPPETTAPPAAPVLLADPVNPGEGAMWIKLPEAQLRIAVGERVLRLSLSETGVMTSALRTTEYISFVLRMALAFAIGFQLPLVMLLLSWLGLMDVEQFAGGRKFALLGCFMFGALMTPADVASMILLAAPMYALFELGLILCRALARKPAPQADP